MGLRKINHDAFAPPVYYAIAGLWYNLGKFFGREGGGLLYWTRFLNVGIYSALMFFSFFMCKKIQGKSRLLPLGVVSLLAFFPQDIFYSINSDVLSPLLFTVSLFLMVQLYGAERRLSFYILTGAMVALTFLTKLSNLAMLIIFVIFASSLAMRFYAAKKVPAYRLHLFALVAAASLPVALWMGFNYYALGEITGTASKIRLLGWTAKPLAEIFDHPVFTPQGISLFLTDLTKTFWWGETLWGMKSLAAGNMHYFFLLSSFVFLAAAATGRLKNKQIIGAGLFQRFGC